MQNVGTNYSGSAEGRAITTICKTRKSAEKLYKIKVRILFLGVSED
jgi:hypothetical protein